MKKTILIISASLLAIIIVAAGVFKFYVKPRYVTPLVLAVEEFLMEEELVDQLIEEYEKSLILEGDTEEDIEGDNQETTTGKEETAKMNEPESAEDENKDKDATPNQVESEKKSSGSGKTVDKLQKEVAPNDLKTGLRISSKIDTGYLMGLSKGGLTAENKKAAKEHLQGRLTAGEYSQLKGLFGKYAHLLK